LLAAPSLPWHGPSAIPGKGSSDFFRRANLRRRRDDRNSNGHKRLGHSEEFGLQNWTTLVKVGIIIVLSALLLSFGHHARDISPAFGAVQRGVGLWSNFGLAMITVLWAYEGWQFGTYSAGESLTRKKPSRALS